MRLLKRGAGARLQDVPGRLHRAEQPLPVDLHPQGRAHHLRLLWAARAEPQADPVLARPAGQPLEQRPVGEGARLRRHRVDAVERQVVAEQAGALGALPHEAGQRMVLELVHLGVGAPFADIGVAPLARHDEVVTAVPPSQPGTQEILGQPVRPGRIDVVNPLRHGQIEHLVRPRAHRLHGPVDAQVTGPPAGDVRRPAQRRQAQAHPSSLLERPHILSLSRASWRAAHELGGQRARAEQSDGRFRGPDLPVAPNLT